jgi:hypothetical protein
MLVVGGLNASRAEHDACMGSTAVFRSAREKQPRSRILFAGPSRIVRACSSSPHVRRAPFRLLTEGNLLYLQEVVGHLCHATKLR